LTAGAVVIVADVLAESPLNLLLSEMGEVVLPVFLK
jgi:hypothetical protein